MQPRSQGSLLGRVGENPGNEVGPYAVSLTFALCFPATYIQTNSLIG